MRNYSNPSVVKVYERWFIWKEFSVGLAFRNGVLVRFLAVNRFIRFGIYDLANVDVWVSSFRFCFVSYGYDELFWFPTMHDILCEFLPNSHSLRTCSYQSHFLTGTFSFCEEDLLSWHDLTTVIAPNNDLTMQPNNLSPRNCRGTRMCVFI